MDSFFCIFDVELQGFLALGQSVQHLPGTMLCLSHKRSFIWAFPHESIYVNNGIIEHEKQSGGCKILAANLWQALEVELKECAWAGYLGPNILCKSAQVPLISTPDAYLQRSSFEAVYDHDTKTLSLAIYPRLIQNSLIRSLLETFNEKRVHEFLFNTPLTRKPYVGFEVTTPFVSLEDYAKKFESIQETLRNTTLEEAVLLQECSFKGQVPPFQLFLDLLQKKKEAQLGFLRLNDFCMLSRLESEEELPFHDLQKSFRTLSPSRMGFMDENSVSFFQKATQVALLNGTRLTFSVASPIERDSNVCEEYYEAKNQADSFLEILNSSEKAL